MFTTPILVSPSCRASARPEPPRAAEDSRVRQFGHLKPKVERFSNPQETCAVHAVPCRSIVNCESPTDSHFPFVLALSSSVFCVAKGCPLHTKIIPDRPTPESQGLGFVRVSPQTKQKVNDGSKARRNGLGERGGQQSATKQAVSDGSPREGIR